MSKQLEEMEPPDLKWCFPGHASIIQNSIFCVTLIFTLKVYLLNLFGASEVKSLTQPHLR
jgi:hypothetical protein